MKLYIDAELIAGKSGITRNDILEVLGAVFKKEELEIGVIDDVVSVVNAGGKALDRRVLKGTHPEPGINGKLLLLVKKYTGQGEVKVDDKGRANFHELHLFDNVKKGDVVARIYPPKPGTPGKDVLGKPVPAPASKPVKVSVSKSLSVQKRAGEDFEVVVAQTEGFLIEDAGKIDIKEELLISGNLDLKLGNIDFIGLVKISGDVSRGLVIRGKKGVHIRGEVQDGIIESAEGDVVIDGFVHGDGRGRIVSARNVVLSIAHNVTAEALGSISITKEALDCRFMAQATISAQKASIVGGLAQAVCGFEIGVIGNEAGQKTKLAVVTNIEATAEFSKLTIDIESHLKAMRLLEVHLGPYVSNPARAQLLNQPFKARILGLLEKHKLISESKLKLELRKKEMLAKAFRNPSQRVNVMDKMYPGCVMMAGEDIFEPKEVITGPCSINYNANTHEFKVGNIEALFCESPFAFLEKEVPPTKGKVKK